MAAPRHQKTSDPTATGARRTTPAGTRAGRQEPREATQKAGAQDMTRCIESCLEVVRAATQCATHCIAHNEEGERQEVILLCLDAADVAGAMAKVAARDPLHGGPLAEACAEVLEACAAECEGMADHQVMEDCAELCRRGAESCRAVAADL